MTRYVPQNPFGVRLGDDAQQRYAARLVLSGFDITAAAELSGLSVDEVKSIAKTIDFTELDNRRATP